MNIIVKIKIKIHNIISTSHFISEIFKYAT